MLGGFRGRDRPCTSSIGLYSVGGVRVCDQAGAFRSSSCAMSIEQPPQRQGGPGTLVKGSNAKEVSAGQRSSGVVLGFGSRSASAVRAATRLTSYVRARAAIDVPWSRNADRTSSRSSPVSAGGLAARHGNTSPVGTAIQLPRPGRGRRDHRPDHQCDHRCRAVPARPAERADRRRDRGGGSRRPLPRWPRLG